jgi:hypothetical protein
MERRVEGRSRMKASIIAIAALWPLTACYCCTTPQKSILAASANGSVIKPWSARSPPCRAWKSPGGRSLRRRSSNQIYSKKIAPTDFQRSEISLYYCNNLLQLPREY